MSLIIAAAQFAAAAHKGQKRKYHGAPYIVHPGRVAARLSCHREATETLIACAWLHDVLEDCPVAPETLIVSFGMDVRRIVGWLTNPSKLYPHKSRAERKSIDREHLTAAPREAKLIKLADRADNLRDMLEAPTSFLRVYVPESTMLAEALAGTDPELEAEYMAALSPLQALLAKIEREAKAQA